MSVNRNTRNAAAVAALALAAALQPALAQLPLAPLQATATQNAATQRQTTLLAQGRTDEAVQNLEVQIGTNPFDPVAMNNLAAVKAARDDWYAAANLLVRAHRLAPGNTVIGNNLKQLNEWLSRRSQPGTTTTETAADQALASIPPEPPALWSGPPSSSAVPSEAPSVLGVGQPKKSTHRSRRQG